MSTVATKDVQDDEKVVIVTKDEEAALTEGTK